MDNVGSVMTHDHIIAAVWGAEQPIEPQFVRVLVANLRQKIEPDPARPQLILTEAGAGYRMLEPEP
jgi:two-component system KDP operon response regulator KdpE